MVNKNIDRTPPARSATQPIRVLHLITGFSLGGATENTLLSVEGLQARGYDVRILTGPSNSSEGDLFEQASRNNVRVGAISSLRRSINPFRDFVALMQLFFAIRKGKFQIVHTHSSKAGILGRIASRLAGVPIVVHTIHGLPFHGYQNPLLRKLFVLAEKLGASLSDRIITVTETIIQKALEEGIGSQEKFITVRSGFDTGPFESVNQDSTEIRRSLGLRPDDLVVGKIARFSLLKGHEHLINVIPRVVAIIPNAKFLFVGSGELERPMREKVAQLGVADYVVFTGLVGQERMPLIISILDVLVHTSLLEGLARVIPQAMVAGKPVVSFDLDGSHEVVINGKTGCLVEPGNESQLADAITHILMDRDKARAMGNCGREFVRSRWTVDAMVNGIDAVYRELLERQDNERDR